MTYCIQSFLHLLRVLDENKLVPSNGTTIAIIYIFSLYSAEQSAKVTNKTQLVDSVPSNLGSISRKRYVLEGMIQLGSIEQKIGRKKSEKNLELSEKVKLLIRESEKIFFEEFVKAQIKNMQN